jgi:hypothetical protein
MKIYVYAFLVGLLLIAGCAIDAGVSTTTPAVNIDGDWAGEVQGMDGNAMKISYTFKADGTALTGTTKGMDGNDISIQDGKIEGNQFSFSLDFGMGMPMNFKGTVTGDQIEMKMDMGDMGGGGMPEMPPIILKKVK